MRKDATGLERYKDGMTQGNAILGRRSGLRGALGLSLALLLHATVLAQSPAIQRGLLFVRTHCAACHAIDRVSPSPLAVAPPLRDLHKRYPVEALEEAFAEGIITGHPSMPEFRLDPGQIDDVIAFLKSLE
jgi:mono/diheme cytochrome c family protein